jgi:hypothetical protein
MAQPVDMSPYGSAELTFDWLIESGFDTGEYVALDFSPDGSNWTEIKRLRGNVDQENTWHNETMDIDPAYLTDRFTIRYRAYVSGSREDANVDNVQLAATSLAAPPSDPPVANAGGPYWGNEGSNVSLDASASFDPDSTVVGYEWDLDNDGQYDDATGVTATFNSTADGTFTVGLRVTDEAGLTDTDTTTVPVANVDPTANAGGPYSGDEGSAIALDGSLSSYPGNDIVSYQWDIGNDGSFELSGANASFAAVSAAGMDGGNGGWPVLYGGTPVTEDTLVLGFDEDQMKDSERAHTTEQVAYIALDPPPESIDASPAALDTNLGGLVTSVDALLVVNWLNSNEVSEAPSSVDLDDDGMATAMDTLVVVNYVNEQSSTVAARPLQAVDSRAVDHLLASLQEDDGADVLEDELLDLLI